MSKKSIKPVSLAVGTVFVTSLTISQVSADPNASPFAMNELSRGYMQLADASGNKPAQEGKSDDKKSEKEGKCGEGKCGGKMKKDMEDKGSEDKSDKESTKK